MNDQSKKTDQAIEIADGIFWVGSSKNKKSLHCNPYLLVDEGRGVLIDPGNPYDARTVLQKIESVIPLSCVDHIILHHQDPDFCLAVPFLEKAGFNGLIHLHWRTGLLVQYYGIKSKMISLHEEDWKLKLASGRTLEFLSAAYLHFPGAVMTWDTKSRVLFSSDLFGAFTEDDALYAGDNYDEAMKSFHEHYMPSHAILGPVMERLGSLDIGMIAPQHGKIITEKIKQRILILRDLECGAMSARSSSGRFKNVSMRNILMHLKDRLVSIHGLEKIAGIFRHTVFDWRENGDFTGSFDENQATWNQFYQILSEKMGETMVIPLEATAVRATFELNLDLPPQISKLIPAELASELMNELKIDSVRDSISLDAVTKLKNQRFFQSFFKQNLIESSDSFFSSVIIYIAIDHLQQINEDLGRESGDAALRSVGYLLENHASVEGDLVFKLNSPVFLYYIPVADLKAANAKAISLKDLVQNSENFVQKLTISLSIVLAVEFKEEKLPIDEMISEVDKIAGMRLSIAQKGGGNTVVDNSAGQDPDKYFAKRILIVDPDEMYRHFLATELTTAGFHPLECADGETAMEICDKQNPDMIVSEVLVPRANGFLIREHMMKIAWKSQVPFVLTANRKDHGFAEKAASLGILHYLQKPVIMAELIGLVRNMTRRGR